MYHKWRSYDVWFLRYKVWQTEFFVIWVIFCPLLTTRKIKILKKWKKIWRYYHFTLEYHKRHHMKYASLDMECNRQFFLSFWAITLLMTQKLKFAKNIKKSWRYYLFTHVYYKLRSYDGWFLRYKVQCNRVFFSFWAIFCSLTLLTIQKIKILKKILKNLEMLSFYTCVSQMTIIKCMRYGVWQTEFFVILCHFRPFLPLTTQKIKILIKRKKCMEISSF